MRFRYSTEENGRLTKKAAVYTQDEHRINFSDVDSQAVYVTERLAANGYETYIVGGAVRDLILGKKPKDFDIVTAASPTKIKKIFRNSRIIGRRFRLVHVFFGPKIFEVSTFRSLKDGPTSNTFGTIGEDVQRRDFTLNALFYDPQKQVVVDYVGGMKDMRRRLIRPIIALPRIFTDDPVRMIRAVKYGAATGFRLPLSLKWKIRKQSGLLADVSPSRLTEEIFKVIHSSRALEIVEGLDAMGLYRYLQPRAAELFRTKPGFRSRYLKTMAALNGEGAGGLPGETLSALVRDYLEDNADWDGTREEDAGESPGAAPPSPPQEDAANREGGPRPPAERYKSAFILARQFVLPMNPPRAELDAALRLLFAEHGVTVKKTKRGERPPRPGALPPRAETGEAARRAGPAGGGRAPAGRKPAAAREKPNLPPEGENPPPPPEKRRSRRRRPKGAGTPRPEE